jgi:hypothetical protein
MDFYSTLKFSGIIIKYFHDDFISTFCLPPIEADTARMNLLGHNQFMVRGTRLRSDAKARHRHLLSRDGLPLHVA